jgi:hypothetical protein
VSANVNERAVVCLDMTQVGRVPTDLLMCEIVVVPFTDTRSRFSVPTGWYSENTLTHGVFSVF